MSVLAYNPEVPKNDKIIINHSTVSGLFDKWDGRSVPPKRRDGYDDNLSF